MSSTITLRVPDDMFEKLRSQAHAKHSTVSEVIRSTLAGTTDRPAAFPAWTGTNASATQLADLIREVDPYATVEVETVGLSWQNESQQLVIDTVPNAIRLRRGDRPAFDGTRWSNVEAQVTS